MKEYKHKDYFDKKLNFLKVLRTMHIGDVISVDTKLRSADVIRTQTCSLKKKFGFIYNVSNTKLMEKTFITRVK